MEVYYLNCDYDRLQMPYIIWAGCYYNHVTHTKTGMKHACNEDVKMRRKCLEDWICIIPEVVIVRTI